MCLVALNRVGGADYLEQQARENPKVFCMLLSRLLPAHIVGDRNNPIVIEAVSNEERRRAAIAAIDKAFAERPVWGAPLIEHAPLEASKSDQLGDANGLECGSECEQPAMLYPKPLKWLRKRLGVGRTGVRHLVILQSRARPSVILHRSLIR
jgi:hypothetical protein